MKIGDLVQHKNYAGGKLRVKNINGEVVVCERIYELKFPNIHGVDRYPVYIIAKENLVPVNQETQTQLPFSNELH